MAATSSASSRRGAGKSANAYRTISEVSEELQVPQHVLRFWETKFSQVRPLKRGGGRRYYRPEDIDLLKQIQTLLYEDGYTIKGVQRLLREGQVRPGGEDGDGATGGSAAAGEASAPARQAVSADGDGDGALPEDVRSQLRVVLSELKALRAALRE